MRCRGSLWVMLMGYLAATAPGWASDSKTAAPLLAQGEYIARAAGCLTCHTDRKQKGRPFAGGRPLKTVYGTFYTPNITPDTGAGIGAWTLRDFTRAMREGLRPAGEHLYPVFPYTAYTKLGDGDIGALWAYLRSLAPVRQDNRAHELKWYAPPRAMVFAWKRLYFTPGRYRADPLRSAAWNRGAYLAEAAAHCGACHTPRNLLGGVETGLSYAGANAGAEDFVAPNITPDRDTGIGKWTTGEVAGYLRTGMTPDGDTAGNVMAEVIDDGLSYLREEDAAAIAQYLKALPPIARPARNINKTAGHRKEEWE